MQRFDASEFDLPRILDLKRRTTIAVCVPALDEEATIGKVTEVLMGLAELEVLDEVVVVDSGSTDRTREVAAATGAHVVVAADVMSDLPAASGKGEAMWKGLAATESQVVCWVDADVTNFHAGFVLGLCGPLLADPNLQFTKAFYARPLGTPASRDGLEREMGEDGVNFDGGRVTELTVRPLLRHLFPELAEFHQPISGEYAGRRELMESLTFETGYGVDAGILIDVWRSTGISAMAEVDLEIRFHRNRPLAELGAMATEVAGAILSRSGGAPAEMAPTNPARPPLSSYRNS